MGVTNFDNLPQNQPVTILSNAAQVLAERKGSAQRVSGSNIHYYTVDNPGTFAWSGKADTAVPGSGTLGWGLFQVTLTSETAAFFLNDLVLEMFKSSDGVTWTPYTTRDFMNGTAPLISYPQPIRAAGSTNAPNTANWYVKFTATFNAWVAFKIQAAASDNVTIATTRIF